MLRQGTYVLTTLFLSGYGIAFLPAQAQIQGTLSTTLGVPSANPQTLLRFETQSYLVRVYQADTGVFLNVYNKETGFTDINSVPAKLLFSDSEPSGWLTYVNQRGDLYYYARVNPEGATELEIRIPNGPSAQPEPGFNASYSFPHVYLGQNITTTLATLESLGWVVDESEENGILLSFDQTALDLKFDPTTGLITQTRLMP
jgi:hypothetical protein